MDKVMNYDALSLEARLVRSEERIQGVQEDIQEIKRTLKWMLGLIFGLNSTIIALLAKGFNIV